MKLKIKVNTDQFLETYPKGDWIDLRAAEDIKSQKGVNLYKVRLGVVMKLPDGFEAIVALRSSSPKKFNIMMANSIGVIDNSYCGIHDEWMCPVVRCNPESQIVINKDDRICQFRIQLSQKATLWQKLKWLLSSGVKIVNVDKDKWDKTNDRGGFGSTGVK